MNSMSQGSPGQAECVPETNAGREFPQKTAVIIRGRLDHMFLGTIVTVSRGFADNIFVVMDREDPHVSGLARSLGAVVIRPDLKEAGLLEAILAGAGAVVIMCGDGTHDPYMIPGMLDCIPGGYDVASCTPGLVPETDVRPGQDFYGRRVEDTCFLASSGSVARSLKLYNGRDPGRQILDHARREGLKIRYLDSRTDPSWLSRYRIGVVVPAYNEERLLGPTIGGIPDYVSRIYVIDDGSRDNTPAVIDSLSDPRVVSVRHAVNLGVGASIIDGYKLALKDGMEIIAVMAGDNQMDPQQLPGLLAPVIEGRADYSKGNRLVSKESRKGMSSWRSLGNFMLSVITKIGSGYWQIMDPQNGYTAVTRQALEAIDLDSVYTYYGYCNDLLIKMNARGLRVVDVAMPARYGSEKSKIRYGRYVRKVAPMIFRGFLWRLKTKYMAQDFHPLVLLYVTGMIAVPLGLLLCAASPLVFCLSGSLSMAYLALAVIVLIAGLQSLFLAMVFDRQEISVAGDKGASYD
jgi:glycosyltransferase involved in cell wall biosynthesis